MANTNPEQQRAINARAEQAVIEAWPWRVRAIRDCPHKCAPLAVVGVGIAHSPDLCGECKKHAAALRWGPRE